MLHQLERLLLSLGVFLLPDFPMHILQYQDKIEQALWKDLHKSPEEAYLTEISIVNGEIDNHIKGTKTAHGNR